MVDLGPNIAKDLGKAVVLVLDAYYSDGTVFKRTSEYKNDHGGQQVHIITRAKKSYVAYEDPPEKSSGSERPRVYGKENN